jgi:LysR family glycine cleavage system transcriptional activator
MQEVAAEMMKDVVPFPLRRPDSEGNARREDGGRPRSLSHPSPRLPPLHLFRAFDAAARHNSFRLAADEMCVTPSAVSQQIRQLEEFLDTRLFRRLTRRVELTHEGSALAGTVLEVMEMLSASCERLRDPAVPAAVCINASPVLALRWLVSCLRQFKEQNDQIKVSLLVSTDPIDFERQDVDIGIRWGKGDFPGMRAERLVDDIVFPICRPDLFEKARTPADLLELPLLQTKLGIPWTKWFEAADVKHGVLSAETIFFNDADVMLEAAASGQGIALVSSLLAANDLRSGRAVRLFDIDMKIDEGFFMLSPERLGNKPATARVREWLQAEALLAAEIVSGAQFRCPSAKVEPRLMV